MEGWNNNVFENTSHVSKPIYCFSFTRWDREKEKERWWEREGKEREREERRRGGLLCCAITTHSDQKKNSNNNSTKLTGIIKKFLQGKVEKKLLHFQQLSHCHIQWRNTNVGLSVCLSFWPPAVPLSCTILPLEVKWEMEGWRGKKKNGKSTYTAT